MYKHILIAVDGSETSNLALKEEIKLAKEQKAALRLIPVVDETSAYMMVEAPRCQASVATRGSGRRGTSLSCDGKIRPMYKQRKRLEWFASDRHAGFISAATCEAMR